MATHGTIGEFDSKSKDWTSYTEQLQQYFIASDVEGAERSALECMWYSYLQAYLQSSAPTQAYRQTFRQVSGTSEESHQTAIIRDSAEIQLQHPSAKEEETVAEFIAELERLSEHWKFEGTLDTMLHVCDRLV